MKRSIRLQRFLGSIVLLCAMVLWAAPLEADDCVDWPKALTWDDFKGDVPKPVQKTEDELNAAKEKLKALQAEEASLEKTKDEKTKERKALLDRRDVELNGKKGKARDPIYATYDPQTEALRIEIEKLDGEIEGKKTEIKEAETKLDTASEAYSKADLAGTVAKLVVGPPTPGECGKINGYPVKAQFCRNSSYATAGAKKSPALLPHEQLHFDIAEQHARALAKKIKEKVDKYNKAIDELDRCNLAAEARKVKQGALEEELKRDVIAATREERLSSKKDQDAYDTESDHGNNQEGQDKWSKDVSDALKPAPAK